MNLKETIIEILTTGRLSTRGMSVLACVVNIDSDRGMVFTHIALNPGPLKAPIVDELVHKAFQSRELAPIASGWDLFIEHSSATLTRINASGIMKERI